MKRIIRLWIYISFALLPSCAKDKTQQSYDECSDFREIYLPQTGFTPGISYVIPDSVHFKYGVFNPNNSDEMAYWGGNTKWNFYSYNLVTKQRVKLTDLIPQNPPKWHRNGWIAFNAEDNNIYKVKSNGDSLTQLTFTRDCFMPEWNLSGDTIICKKASPSPGVYFIKADGSLVTYVNYNQYSLSFPSWAPFDSIIINTSGFGLSQLNFFDSSWTILKIGNSSALGACWFPDGKRILWSVDYQPMLLDYATLEQHALVPYCQKEHYMYPSISGDGKYALLSMETQVFVSTGIPFSSFRIVRIEIATGKEEILDLPD